MLLANAIPDEWLNDFRSYQERLARRLGGVLAGAILLLFPVFVCIDFLWIAYENPRTALFNTAVRLPAYLAALVYLLLLTRPASRWIRPGLWLLSMTLIASMAAMFVIHKLMASEHIHYVSHGLTMSLIIVAVATTAGARELILAYLPPLSIATAVLAISGEVPSAGAVYPVYLGTAAGIGLIISEMLHRGHIDSFLAWKKLEQHALTDALTGLLNRRAMQLRLNTEHAQAKRQAIPVCLMLADLDRFKRINDQYGHDVGDEVLVELANRMQSLLRASDSVARWGGEEFLILVSGSHAQEAQEVAEKLRRRVGDVAFKTGAGEITVTISIGVAPLKPQQSIEEAIRQADAALYQAKQNGRNQTRLAT